MTNHLSPQEFVNALGGKDGVLADSRQSHLDACPSCQAQIAELRALMEDAGQGADVPEPSPLFWDHFQARVLTAVQSEGQPGRQAWWAGLLDARTLVALSASVVAIVAIVASVALYKSRPVAPGPGGVTDSGNVVESSAVSPLDNDEWEFVASMMGDLEGDDIHEVLAPSRDAVDAAIETLTVAERDRFVKLLKGELGEGLE